MADNKSYWLITATHPNADAENVQFYIPGDHDPNNPDYVNAFLNNLAECRPGHGLEEWTFTASRILAPATAPPSGETSNPEAGTSELQEEERPGEEDVITSQMLLLTTPSKSESKTQEEVPSKRQCLKKTPSKLTWLQPGGTSSLTGPDTAGTSLQTGPDTAEGELEGVAPLVSYFVHVANVASTFDENHFLKIVHIKGKLAKDCGVTCVRYDKDLHTVTLEFPSFADAKHFAGLESFEYDGQETIRTLEGPLENECVPTTWKVLISNVASTYDEEHFLKIVRVKGNVSENCCVSCLSYDEDLNTVVLEFTSSADAARFADLQSFIYDGQETIRTLEGPLVKESVPTTWKVLISNVASTYDEKHFLKIVRVKGNLSENCCVSCLSYDEDLNTVVLEFTSSADAARFADLQSFVYDGQETIRTLQGRLHNECVPTTAKVLISNVASTYDEKHFLKIVRVKGNLSENCNVTCLSYDEDRKTVVLEFSSSEEAAQFAGLRRFVYDEEDTSVCLFYGTVSEGDFDDPQDRDYEEESDEDPDEVHQVLTTLKSQRATLAFLQECDVHCNGKSFRITSKALDSIVQRLYDIHKVDVTPAECRRRWGTLGDTYGRLKGKELSRWKCLPLMRKLKGDAKPKKVAFVPKKGGSYVKSQVTPPANMKRSAKRSVFWDKKAGSSTASSSNACASPRTAKIATFSKGMKFSNAAVVKLISLRELYHDSFDASGRNDRVWDSICQDMIDSGHYHSPSQCMEKWNRLAAKFKDHLLKEKSTGASPSKFQFSEEMAFMRKWVNVEPHITISLGSSFKIMKRAIN